MTAALATTGRKALASAAVLAAAASVAGLGTFGTFTSTTSASEDVATGTVQIGFGATNRLTVAASGLVPGDTVNRAVTLTNSGTQSLAGLTLTTTATTSSLLDTNTTEGLQLLIRSCSVAWTESGTAPAYTYTCPGTTTTIVASRPVIGTNLDLGALNSLTPAGNDHLVATLTLPSAAGNTLQGQNSTISFAFTGTQRAATDK